MNSVFFHRHFPQLRHRNPNSFNGDAAIISCSGCLSMVCVCLSMVCVSLGVCMCVLNTYCRLDGLNSEHKL